MNANKNPKTNAKAKTKLATNYTNEHESKPNTKEKEAKSKYTLPPIFFSSILILIRVHSCNSWLILILVFNSRSFALIRGQLFLPVAASRFPSIILPGGTHVEIAQTISCSGNGWHSRGGRRLPG
jgi:hypothetical protein